MLHDASSTFAANDTLVDRVVTIAFNVLDRPVFEVDFDAATTGAHVTCGGFDLVPGFW